MANHRVSVLIVCMLILGSCKKDPIQYTFEGTITENTASAPLSGVEVGIKQLEVNNSVSTTLYDDAGTAVTDANGFYTMSFERKKISQFKVDLRKSGFFNKDVEISAGEISSENSNVLNYEMDAKSWVNFDIENTGLSDPGDEFLIILYTYRTGCTECASEDYNYFYGDVDTNFKIATTAGSYFKFTYSQVGVNSYTDSVYLTPFDTVNYVINY